MISIFMILVNMFGMRSTKNCMIFLFRGLSHLHEIQIFWNFLELIKHKKEHYSASLKFFEMGLEEDGLVRTLGRLNLVHSTLFLFYGKNSL
jgi:hypothetical protein